MFKCVVCGKLGGEIETSHKPRDRKDLKIVDCPCCGHRQLYPLLSDKEFESEYAEDRTVKRMLEEHDYKSDLEGMRTKFLEWTKIHVDMYWNEMQNCQNVINLGSGYGFFEEEVNRRPERRFNILGNEIGEIRVNNYVGGEVCTLDFNVEDIPSDMQHQYDLILCMHVLEHMNQPVEYLKKVKGLLKKEAKIIVEVPNLNSFLCELSKEYKEFFYLYEHVSYFTSNTLAKVFALAGYNNIKTYTKEIYSIENHINWIRTGLPFTKYNQMFLPDERIEFINRQYKEAIGKMGKGYSLICEATN